MSRAEWALVAAGFLGFGLAGLGHAVGWRWVIYPALLLAGVAILGLIGIQQGTTRRERREAEGSDAWVVWIFVGTMILQGIIGMLLGAGFLT
jgi:hypothetical protein